MIVKQIIHLNILIGIEILGLVDQIKDKDFTLTNYWKYLKKYHDQLGLFGAFLDSGRLVGFLHGERPSELHPNKGYLYISATLPEIGRRGSQELIWALKQWMAYYGATYMVGHTQRSPRALHRLYGAELLTEREVVVPIDGDDYKSLKREDTYDV